MATDFVSATYAAILALWRANTSQSKALVRRWVVFNGTDRDPDRLMNRKPGDLAEVTFDFDSATDSIAAGRTINFGGFSSAGAVSWERRIEATYKATIVVADVRLTAMANLVNAMTNDLMNGGVYKLTVTGAAVVVGKPTFKNQRTQQNDGGGTMRRVGTLLIPVSISFRGETQI